MLQSTKVVIYMHKYEFEIKLRSTPCSETIHCKTIQIICKDWQKACGISCMRMHKLVCHVQCLCGVDCKESAFQFACFTSMHFYTLKVLVAWCRLQKKWFSFMLICNEKCVVTLTQFLSRAFGWTRITNEFISDTNNKQYLQTHANLNQNNHKEIQLKQCKAHAFYATNTSET